MDGGSGLSNWTSLYYERPVPAGISDVVNEQNHSSWPESAGEASKLEPYRPFCFEVAAPSEAVSGADVLDKPITIQGAVREVTKDRSIITSIAPTTNGRLRRQSVKLQDKDFNSLPDYSPPVSSLPTDSLKVDWKRALIDLRFDPHLELLHPEEIRLAAGLRLDCATYLTSKRRIFIKRIEMLRIDKEFTKSHAQHACKIDVNKASKLWQAFEKVGWFDPRHFSRA